jgi:hypothetical protein
MGLFKDLFNLTEDVLALPIDLVGITNHHEKKAALDKAKRMFMRDEITVEEYNKVKDLLS